MERKIGLPPDLVEHDDVVFPMSAELPASAYHVTEQIKELHRRGIDGSGVVVAVNDTGLGRHDFIPKPIAIRDFTNSRNGTNDMHGHGTHCSGIVISLAPKANLIIAKVLGDSGSGSTTGINAGREWAAKEGAHVISESLGDNGGPDIPADIAAYHRAYEHGALICNAALGNAGFNGRNNSVGRPGSYVKVNHGIGALKRDWTTRADFSSGGPASRFYAPGDRIVSCLPGNRWGQMSGTSMACPWKAGADALTAGWLMAIGKPVPQGAQEWEDFYVKNGFVVDLHTPGWDAHTGYGRIDYVKLFATILDETKV